jgi:hypothetical protein
MNMIINIKTLQTMLSKRRPIIGSGQDWLLRKVGLEKFRSTKLRKKRLLAIGAEKRWRAALPSKLAMTCRPKMLAKSTVRAIPPEAAVECWQAANLTQKKPRIMKTGDGLAGSHVYANEISE